MTHDDAAALIEQVTRVAEALEDIASALRVEGETVADTVHRIARVTEAVATFGVPEA